MDYDFSYIVSLPSKLIKGEVYPTIFALHGMGSNEKDILDLLEELKESFIIIAIRGTIALDNGFEYFKIKSIGHPDLDSFDKGVNYIEDVINDPPEGLPIDKDEKYILGFSQGAILSMTLALKMGNKIKGIVALSGYIPAHVKEDYAIKSVEELKIFIGHGESDPLFPIRIGKENFEYLKARSKAVVFKTYAMGHQVSLDEKNDFVEWILGN